LNAAKAAAIFAGAWIPLPFLRVRERRPDGNHLFDQGPWNWARARLVELPAPDADGHTHRVTLAFDTQLLPTREGRPYLAPSPLDMQSGEEFALSDAEADTGWLLDQEWVQAIGCSSISMALNCAAAPRAGWMKRNCAPARTLKPPG
jgi:hypothetical protein